MDARTAVARPMAPALAIDLAALLGFSLAVYVTAGVIRTPMALPGHSAVFWMPVLLLAACRRPGLTAGSALVGGSVGLAAGGIRPDEMAALMLSASVVEALGLSTATHWRPALLLAAGIAGNLAKLGLKALTLGLLGLPLNKHGLPFGPTLAIYAASGLIAGFIALGVLYGWDRLRKRGPVPPTTE